MVRLGRGWLNTINHLGGVGVSILYSTRPLEQEKIDVIFLDINMPIINGIEATESILKKNISQNNYASNWSHVVLTRGDTTSSTYKIYINNSNVFTTTTVSGNYGAASAAGDRVIGGSSTDSDSESNRYQGDLAVYRFYNGKALTSTEVATNYNVSASRFGL